MSSYKKHREPYDKPKQAIVTAEEIQRLFKLLTEEKSSK